MPDYPRDPRGLLAYLLDGAHLAKDAPADLYAHVRRVVDGTAAARGEDLRARRACWTCHKDKDYDCPAFYMASVSDWVDRECGDDGRPRPTARDCPGYEDAP
jgi:hypothetical protein